jgi:hypothetical protein
MTGKSLREQMRDQILAKGLGQPEEIAGTSSRPTPSPTEKPVALGGLIPKKELVSDRELQFQELRDWESRLAEQARENERSAKEILRLRQDLERDRQAVIEAQDQISEKEQKYLETLRVASQLEAGWVQLKNSQAEHQAALARLDDLDSREAQLIQDKARVEEESTILAGLELDLVGKRADLDELELAASKAKDDANSIRSEWHQLKSDLSSSLAHSDEQAFKIDELKKARTQLRRDLKEVQQQIEIEVGLRKQAQREARAAQKAFGQLETEHHELSEDHEKLKTNFREHKRTAEAEKRTAIEAVQNRFKKELSEAKSRGKALPSASSMTNLPLILELSRHGDMEEFPPSMTACTSGSTPWPEIDFDDGLREIGFEVYEFPNANEEIVVLGRDGWSKESILKQIDLRGESALRFYSQELFMLGLLRGEDPLETWDRNLLLHRPGIPLDTHLGTIP